MAGSLISIPLVAASLVLSVVPVWSAAKVVGAGRTEFARSAVALALPTVLTVVLLHALGAGALLVAPLLFWCSFKFLLETSFFRALVLAVVWLAFQASINKLFAALGWA